MTPPTPAELREIAQSFQWKSHASYTYEDPEKRRFAVAAQACERWADELEALTTQELSVQELRKQIGDPRL